MRNKLSEARVVKSKQSVHINYVFSSSKLIRHIEILAQNMAAAH